MIRPVPEGVGFGTHNHRPATRHSSYVAVTVRFVSAAPRRGLKGD